MRIRFIEGSLEVKLPTTWTDGKAEVGRVREEKRREEKKREEKKRKDAGAPKARKKSRNTVFFFRGSGGSASRVPKAAGAEPSG